MMRLAKTAAFLIVLAAGCYLRLAAAWRLDSPAKLKEYSRIDYYEFGRSLREFGVLGWKGEPSAFRGSAYPAFLSVVEDYRPAGRPRVPWAQAFLGCFAIPLAAWAAWEIGSSWSGLAAAAFVAFHPALSHSVPACRIEPFYGLLLLLVAVAMVFWSRRPAAGRSLLLGFAIAASLLCRATLFVFPAVLAGAFWRRPGFAASRRTWAAVLIAASYLFLLPWVARNACQFGKFIPFEHHAATRNFFAASLGMVRNISGPYQDKLAYRIDPAGARAQEDPSEHILKLALQSIAADPASYFLSCLRRLGYMLGHNAAVFFLALAGFILRRKEPGCRALAVLCAYFVLVHAPMTLEDRYLEPLLPCALILAGCAAPDLASRAVKKGSRFEWCVSLWRKARVREQARPDQWHWALALVLSALIPLYGLINWRLAVEIALSRSPCSLPESGLSRYYCARQQARDGNLEAAKHGLDKAVSLLERRPMAARQLKARVFLESVFVLPEGLGSNVSARLGEVAADFPEEALQKALWLQGRGRLREALALFDLLVRQHPKNARYLTDRGVARVLAGDSRGGWNDFRRAVGLEPGNPQAGLNLGACLERAGRGKEALAVYAQALAAARAPDPEQLPSPYVPLLESSRERLLRKRMR